MHDLRLDPEHDSKKLNPEWTPFEMNTILNRHNPEWSLLSMNLIKN